MNASTHRQLADFIWGICNLLRGPYKRNEYRKVILPLTVLRRFDCVLSDTKESVLASARLHAQQSENVRHQLLTAAAERPFYNTSKFDFARLLDDPNQIATNLSAYIHAYSPNVRDVMERFDFDTQIGRMDEKDLLFQVVQRFANLDLSPQRVDNMQMGYVFEELIRIGAEQSNEEAGEHFTPREVIRLMVSLLLSPEADLGKPHIVKTIYDPACGTGGMLTVAERFLRDHNADAKPHLFGQDINDESWAVCRSDMLIKGDDADRILLGDSFTTDGYRRRSDDIPWTFDYMLANPPFGVEWKQQEKAIKAERDTLGFQGRFGAGLPRINDGSLLFLQHMLSKMQPVAPDGTGGSRIAIVFNGSPLFTGDAGSGESNIRKWIIENDWLEAIIALPDQLFYNTGISTYIWILTNRKEERRRGKVQLIDAREFYVKMRRSLGNKRNELSPEQIADLTRIHGSFTDGETRDTTDEDPITHEPRTRPRVVSKVFDNDDFGYRKITVERPLRLNFAATPERIAGIENQTTFVNLAKSRKQAGAARDAEVAEGEARQQALREALGTLAETTDGEIIFERDVFATRLRDAAEAHNVKLSAPERNATLAALSERDPEAGICEDRRGNPEPDTSLRDTETVPLGEDIDAYMEREVRPHVPDAWIDHDKTKIGYEIPFNRHFYVYESPPPSRTHRSRSSDPRDRDCSTPRRGHGVKPVYPDYSASGVASIGDIPSHWQSKDLCRIGHFFKGGGGTKEDETEEGHPCIRYGDLYTRHDYHVYECRSRINPDRAAAYTQLEYGDLLLAGSGETLEEIGKSAVNLLREPAFCGGDVIILRPEVDIDATYLGYAADCAPSRCQKLCMGRGRHRNAHLQQRTQEARHPCSTVGRAEADRRAPRP